MLDECFDEHHLVRRRDDHQGTRLISRPDGNISRPARSGLEIPQVQIGRRLACAAPGLLAKHLDNALCHIIHIRPQQREGLGEQAVIDNFVVNLDGANQRLLNHLARAADGEGLIARQGHDVEVLRAVACQPALDAIAGPRTGVLFLVARPPRCLNAAAAIQHIQQVGEVVRPGIDAIVNLVDDLDFALFAVQLGHEFSGVLHDAQRRGDPDTIGVGQHRERSLSGAGFGLATGAQLRLRQLDFQHLLDLIGHDFGVGVDHLEPPRDDPVLCGRTIQSLDNSFNLIEAILRCEHDDAARGDRRANRVLIQSARLRPTLSSFGRACRREEILNRFLNDQRVGVLQVKVAAHELH